MRRSLRLFLLVSGMVVLSGRAWPAAVSSTTWQVIPLSAVPPGAPVDSTIHPVIMTGGGGPSVPTFVSAGTIATDSFATNHVDVPAPASIQTNDLIIAQIQFFNSAGNTTGQTISPGVWTQIRCDGTGTATTHTCLYWHLATGVGDGPWTFTNNGTVTVDYMDGIATAFRGANVTTPIDVNAGNSSTSTNSLTSSPITPMVNSSLLVAFYAFNGGTACVLNASLAAAYNSNDAYWCLMAGTVNAPNAGVVSGTYLSTSNIVSGATTETINIRP